MRIEYRAQGVLFSTPTGFGVAEVWERLSPLLQHRLPGNARLALAGDALVLRAMLPWAAGPERRDRLVADLEASAAWMRCDGAAAPSPPDPPGDGAEALIEALRLLAEDRGFGVVAEDAGLTLAAPGREPRSLRLFAQAEGAGARVSARVGPRPGILTSARRCSAPSGVLLHAALELNATFVFARLRLEDPETLAVECCVESLDEEELVLALEGVRVGALEAGCLTACLEHSEIAREYAITRRLIPAGSRG